MNELPVDSVLDSELITDFLKRNACDEYLFCASSVVDPLTGDLDVCGRPAVALKYWRADRYPDDGEDCVGWVCKSHVNRSKADEIIPVKQLFQYWRKAFDHE